MPQGSGAVKPTNGL